MPSREQVLQGILLAAIERATEGHEDDGVDEETQDAVDAIAALADDEEAIAELMAEEDDRDGQIVKEGEESPDRVQSPPSPEPPDED